MNKQSKERQLHTHREIERDGEGERQTNIQTDKQFSIELCVFHALCENCLNSLAEKLTNSPPYAVIYALVAVVVVVVVMQKYSYVWSYISMHIV